MKLIDMSDKDMPSEERPIQSGNSCDSVNEGDADSPPVQPLFLCGANLSGLLNTASFSLGVASGRRTIRELSGEGEQRRELQTVELHLPLDECEGIQDPTLPQLASPIPIEDSHTQEQASKSVLLVTQPALSSPVQTRGEPSTVLSRHEIPSTQDTISDEITTSHPTFQHQYSQRSSMASSLSSVREGEAPLGYYWADSYRAHSRNLSETPSIPPHHCSSTSSAYHSRNSSLGSQFSSSCFESDSLVTDTGSYGDLKYPRFNDLRQCEVPPMSYTSEWSIRHHMYQPLRPSSEVSLVELNNSPSLKSSEWIKHQLSMSGCKESLVHVKVSSKTKHVVHFNVRAGDVVVWEFATKKKDIAFGVLFEATQVAIDAPEIVNPEEKVLSVLPMFRKNSHNCPVFGTHVAPNDGVYEIVFDNTYSRFFGKELFYRIQTQ